MPVQPPADGPRGIGVLLRDLAEGSADLVRGEVRLARIEIGAVAGAAGRGTAYIATGGVLIVLGVLAAFTGLVLLIGDQWLPRDLYWLGALLFALIAGVVAGWLLMRGRKALSPSALAPHDTVATLKEDGEWLKRQLTSGRTSS
ncbi:MAG: phage holin family protein [Gemmatimonadaceae bacterium]